jgi:hypothetical protein
MEKDIELNLDELSKIAGGETLPAEVDLLDPAQEMWRDAIRSSAAARKTFAGTSLAQTINDIQESYCGVGMELIHLAEFLTPLWDTLVY